MKILVTGANGQLGKSIRKISKEYPGHEFIFTDIEEMDITKQYDVIKFFIKTEADYCINAAAYTNVDKAEEENELCNLINRKGAKNLAIASSLSNTKLIHISSDYVYNPSNDKISLETSPINPIGIYAKSKLEGEQAIKKHLLKHLIIRTSWLYSEFGNNFVKTIIRLGKVKNELSVVNDQIGSPTYATDLAYVIFNIIKKDRYTSGIYNFSNDGNISWFEFAEEINSLIDSNCKIKSIPSSDYPTIAPRPRNSKMSKSKIINTFGVKVPEWKKSLKICISLLKKEE